MEKFFTIKVLKFSRIRASPALPCPALPSFPRLGCSTYITLVQHQMKGEEEGIEVLKK